MHDSNGSIGLRCTAIVRLGHTYNYTMNKYINAVYAFVCSRCTLMHITHRLRAIALRLTAARQLNAANGLSTRGVAGMVEDDGFGDG